MHVLNSQQDSQHSSNLFVHHLMNNQPQPHVWIATVVQPMQMVGTETFDEADDEDECFEASAVAEKDYSQIVLPPT